MRASRKMLHNIVPNGELESSVKDEDSSGFPEKLINSNGPGTYYMDQQGNCYFLAAPPALNTQFTSQTSVEVGNAPKINPPPTDPDTLDDLICAQEVIENDLKANCQSLPSTELSQEDLNFFYRVQQQAEQIKSLEESIKSIKSEIKINSKSGSDSNSSGQSALKEEVLYNCSECDYTNSRKYILVRHMKSHSDYRPYTCTICYKCFKNAPALQNHVNAHLGTKPYSCRVCESSFTTTGELARHCRYKHILEKPHKCSMCSYSSVELYKLKRHILRHSKEHMFPCMQCSYSATSISQLKVHAQSHSSKIIHRLYECDVCHLDNLRFTELKRHKIQHTGNEMLSFPCNLCPTTCTRRKDLITHIRLMHFSNHPVKCDKCQGSFSDRFALKMHSKTHKEVKTFKCDICPVILNSQRQLQSHNLFHTKKELFSCEECSLEFEEKYLLKRHLKSFHYGPPSSGTDNFKCVECDKQFPRIEHLIKHLAMHDSLKVNSKKNSASRLSRNPKTENTTDSTETSTNSIKTLNEEESTNVQESLTDQNGNIEIVELRVKKELNTE